MILNQCKKRPLWFQCLCVAMLLGALFAGALLIKASFDLTRSGLKIQEAVLNNYKIYLMYSLARLTFWVWVVAAFFFGVGSFLYICFIKITNRTFHWLECTISACVFFGFFCVFQFSQHLLHIPSKIMANSLYRASRFYPLWDQLSPERLLSIQWGLGAVGGLLILVAAVKLLIQKNYRSIGSGVLWGGMLIGIWVWCSWEFDLERLPVKAQAHSTSSKLNVLMIGSDSLRFDKFSATGNTRGLTPFMDSLAEQGVFFANMYVPMGRTCPSITSLMTGTWPQTHGFRDNYISDIEAKNIPTAFPQILKDNGYLTAALGDWAAGDLSHIDFGFDEVDVAENQWNIKYLMRQGPKDLRLFLGLFSHNRFGRVFLPEIYYVAGTPLNQDIARRSKESLNHFAGKGQPFFLNIFTASTHGPFGSQYPFYTLFSNPDYAGESKFCMFGLTTPEEIEEKQKQGKAHFDVQQILDLYDGAVRSFDDLVSEIVDHLEKLGLRDNTLIIIYSDHGSELFDRDAWGQGNEVVGNDYSARVPFIIVDPRKKRGHVIQPVVRSIDFAPTLLDLLGFTAIPSMEGISLSPYLDTPASIPELVAYNETGFWFGHVPGAIKNHKSFSTILEMIVVPDYKTGTLALNKKLEVQAIQAKDRMIRKGKWKLVYLPTEAGYFSALFDMENDPRGNVDLSDKYPDVHDALLAELEPWLEKDRRLLDSMQGDNE